MERFFVFYLLKQAALRLIQFLKHWYADGFLYLWHKVFGILGGLDRSLAVKITARYWLKPLYQDRTIVGYVLGFIFRTGRIILGSVIYAIIFIIGIGIYLTWASVPAILVLKSFS